MTRNRRYLISAAVLTAGVGITLGVLAMLPPRPGPTKANFDRIEEGMTLVEVEAILVGKERNWNGWRTWRHADGAEIAVHFEFDHLDNKQWCDSTESTPDKLRRWFYLPPAE